ncbi:MAG: DUF1934 domain-containing protein [Oscillospiraceae bacterium]|nr:DUF1934 domain-containing protein [Oscillospiraceae bacterium]
MSTRVMLSITGTQRYADQEPEVIELVTEGTMCMRDGGWEITYQESALTGLEGVQTTFRVQPQKVMLLRTGRLQSQMVFQQGVAHDSLYQMEFGTLMLRVCANQVFFDITPDGGVIDLVYEIEIENSAAGVIDYHLDIRAME